MTLSKVLTPAVVLLLASGFVLNDACHAQIKFNREPISYSQTSPTDPIAKLQQRIDAGQLELKFDESSGYLPDVLKQLGISTTSQTLVFSKTSFQQRLISPLRPRALYFNDEVYIGWVANGDVLEVASVDPQLGAVFYTLRQQPNERPKFVRDRGNCLTCHASSRTHGVPGHLIRSVYPAPSGQPHFGAGTFRTTHASPLKERWGGWYVTGTHGRQRHMGNVTSQDRRKPERLDIEAGANVTDLKKSFSTRSYLTKHSDIVALMVLEHQTEMHNFLTRAGYVARDCQYYDASMNRIFERASDHISDTSKRRMDSAAQDLLEYMLFVGEAKLTDVVKGTTDYAVNFSKIGPHDPQGRSIREFDLKRRLFKYPCSYLIYSDSFLALPQSIKTRVYRGLWNVLTEKDTSKTFAHLSHDDRVNILSILRHTHSDLPTYWHAER